MAVLPDNVGGGNGILGGRFAERRPRIAAFLNDRSNALTQFGLGLLSGSNRQEAWGNAAQGLAYGRQADQAGRDRRQEDEEKARQDEAINNLLMSPEFASLPEEYRTMLTNDRELARSFLASDLTRRTTPAPTRPPIEVNGQLVDPVTYQVVGDYRDPTNTQRPPIEINGQLVDPTTHAVIGDYRDPPQPGYRDLTDPAERAARGIAADDTRPYQVGPDNELHAVGGSGVTINNGTVDERRYNLLYRTAVDELPTLDATFASLGGLGDQATELLPAAIGRFLQSDDYQRAKYAAIAVIQAQTYAMTGAAAPESEAERLASLMLPAAGDSPAAIADKLDRIHRAIANLGNYADLTSPSPGGVGNPRVSGSPDGAATIAPPGAVEWAPGILFVPPGG